MRWGQVQELEAARFKRLTGVSPATFELMRQAAQASEPCSTHPKRGGKRGPKARLCLEERLLMLLMYYREYRSFAHIGASFGLSEAQSWRIITGLEERLIKNERFHLTRKQHLRSETQWQMVVVDVGEHPVERPKKSSAPATRARRSATRSKARC